MYNVQQRGGEMGISEGRREAKWHIVIFTENKPTPCAWKLSNNPRNNNAEQLKSQASTFQTNGAE